MMTLCTGSVEDTRRRQQLVIDDTGSIEGVHAFIYCTKWSSGQVLPMPDSHLKDRATQLFIKYKSGALVTQYYPRPFSKCVCCLEWTLFAFINYFM